MDPGETCDDGNLVRYDTCSDLCLLECTDGIIERHETCEDVDLIDLTNGCDSTCNTHACGNNATQAWRGEECDDGALVNGDGCDSDCINEICGNNKV